MSEYATSGVNGGTDGSAYGAYDKLLANARRKTQRVLNNELLEARLRQWPRDRVLVEVDACIREVLNEKTKARHVAAVKEAMARAKAERSANLLKFRSTAAVPVAVRKFKHMAGIAAMTTANNGSDDPSGGGGGGGDDDDGKGVGAGDENAIDRGGGGDHDDDVDGATSGRATPTPRRTLSGRSGGGGAKSRPATASTTFSTLHSDSDRTSHSGGSSDESADNSDESADDKSGEEEDDEDDDAKDTVGGGGGGDTPTRSPKNRVDVDALTESSKQGRARRIIRSTSTASRKKEPRSGKSQRKLRDVDRKFNADRYLDSVVTGTKHGDIMVGRGGGGLAYRVTLSFAHLLYVKQ